MNRATPVACRWAQARAVWQGAAIVGIHTPEISLLIVLVLCANERGKTANKAGYTATLVACGWAGAVVELLNHLGKCSEAKDRKNIKKVKW